MPPKKMQSKKKQFKKGKPNQFLKVVKPFREFMQYQASGGLVLLSCVIIALFVANIPIIGADYLAMWETNVGIIIGPSSLEKPLVFWVNDLLMVIFFFLIGLEIKREVIIGELSTPSNTIAPIIGAIGGMITPALFFLLFNPIGTAGATAWAIPIATDIAISLGILSVFGKMVPTSLKIFLTTLAIADDIGGVLVIALVYSHGLVLLHLALALLIFIILLILNRMGIRNILPYGILGVVLWFEFLLSGIHPTIAGILIALSIPATTKIDLKEFNDISSELVRRINSETQQDQENVDIVRILNISRTLEVACNDVETPLQQVEHVLTKWLAFVIVPIFALANAGVVLEGAEGGLVSSSVPIGIIVGLVIGKPLGVILAVWIGIRIGIINLPEDVSWQLMIATAFLTGIGFTISTFIASLSIADAGLLASSKVAILLASLISGALGFFSLRYAIKKREESLIPYIPSKIPGTPNIITTEENIGTTKSDS